MRNDCRTLHLRNEARASCTLILNVKIFLLLFVHSLLFRNPAWIIVVITASCWPPGRSQHYDRPTDTTPRGSQLSGGESLQCNRNPATICDRHNISRIRTAPGEHREATTDRGLSTDVCTIYREDCQRHRCTDRLVAKRGLYARAAGCLSQATRIGQPGGSCKTRGCRQTMRETPGKGPGHIEGGCTISALRKVRKHLSVYPPHPRIHDSAISQVSLESLRMWGQCNQ